MSFAAFDEAPNGADPFTATDEADPAADFLARQQNQMADLESTETNNNNGFGVTDFPETVPTNGTAHEENPQNGDTSSDPYSAIQAVDRLQSEPEKIKRWREEFAQRITDKDEAEEAKRGELHEIASKELSDWQRHYEEQLEKQKASNRQAEVEFIKQRDEETPGSEWERVCWLCDFNPKNSKQVKDVSRMRGLLLQLKQQQTAQ